MASGVKVLLFRGGLLHTKSIAVDGEYSLFGSLNLDPRSLHLNFETTLAIYDAAFTAELEKLQAEYAAESHVPSTWRNGKPEAWDPRVPPERSTVAGTAARTTIN